MIVGDTGPLHLAAAASTPIVSMFGPTDPKRNGPWASDDVSVSEFHRLYLPSQEAVLAGDALPRRHQRGRRDAGSRMRLDRAAAAKR